MLDLAEKFQLSLLVLIGSYDTSEFRSGESDIDIAFISDDTKYASRQLELANDLCRIFKYSKIDLIDLQKASGLLKYEVATKGRLLYEQSEGFFERYKLYCYRYYYDTYKFRQGRKEYFQEQLGVLLDG
ncbi:MAG: nucleotidyltransferase domain-containing protein [Clostridia bacterium]|jgi:predicted nucleotidyltransferase|nr:nucleotidyltransferase domain-containing protein [Clostridia bacterium]